MRKYLIASIVFMSLVLTLAYWMAAGKIIPAGGNAPFEQKIMENRSCITSIEKRIVRGDSLSGLAEPGSTVDVLFGYYRCNEIRRGDIIAYNYSGDPNPIIKIVKGLPGDRFHLQEAGGVWNILIGGETTRNSKGEPYTLGGKSYEMLSLYERDYKGVIPPGSYMILGNLASGSLDSSRFGLVGKGDVLGKVELAGY